MKKRYLVTARLPYVRVGSCGGDYVLTTGRPDHAEMNEDDDRTLTWTKVPPGRLDTLIRALKLVGAVDVVATERSIPTPRA